jgi:tetratricopeptide (TPR) repeat protein
MIRTRLLPIAFYAWIGIAAGAQEPGQRKEHTAEELIQQAQAFLEEARQEQSEKSRAFKYREALIALKSALDRDAQNIEAKLLAGETLMDIDNYDDALTTFKDVLAVEPKNFRANLGIGKIWLANNYWRQALSALEKAADVAPSGRKNEAVRLLAEAYSGSGDRKRATERIDEIVKDDPNDVEALKLLVRLMRDANRYDEAVGRAEQLVAVCDTLFRQAPSDLERVKQLDAAYTLQLSVLGVDNREGLVQRYYERDTRGVPTDKALAGKERDAARVYAKIADVSTKQAAVRQILAYHDALISALEAVKLDAGNVTYLTQLARLYQLIGDQANAGRVFQQILEKDPENEEARKALAASVTTVEK